jgi:hypothetical protein
MKHTKQPLGLLINYLKGFVTNRWSYGQGGMPYGVIQVHNGIGMEVENLFLSVVNMLQVVARLETNVTNDLCGNLAMLNVRMMVRVQNQNFHILMVLMMILNLMKILMN